LRSGLYNDAGMKTVVIEDLEPGISYRFTPYRGATPISISSDELLQSDLPVTLKVIEVEAAHSEAVPQQSGTEAGAASPTAQPDSMP